ncbi:odorant receptor 131-2-like [Brachyhypopomus gauderio]|uniref:odorant receptor 131-2-like n=1 Tax=Brachyhypopomus gauderio TaxID=698409 RepID=UPI0040422E14
MAGTNKSSVNDLIYDQMAKLNSNEAGVSKSMVATLLIMFCTYVNCIMFYTLMYKRIFKETPRYILFAHMLLNDSVHLLLTSFLFLMAQTILKLAKAACSFIIFLTTTTFRNAPLNLALMSLERYVAICFPLRHIEIATQKRTYLAIGFIWCIGSINILVDVLFAAVMDPNFFTIQINCIREQIFMQPWQLDVYNGFNVFYFVSVTVIIMFTYISILITARSVSSNKDSAKKSHRTVLLHFIQLGLCLTSFLHGTIERALYVMTVSDVFLYTHLRYLNFLFVLVLPRFLSPLIYGLRDDGVRPLFTYYFCYGARKFKPKINVP